MKLVEVNDEQVQMPDTALIEKLEPLDSGNIKITTNMRLSVGDNCVLFIEHIGGNTLKGKTNNKVNIHDNGVTLRDGNRNTTLDTEMCKRIKSVLSEQEIEIDNHRIIAKNVPLKELNKRLFQVAMMVNNVDIMFYFSENSHYFKSMMQEMEDISSEAGAKT